MKKLNVLDWVALVLVLVGALNWGLVGFFSYDLVKSLFGDMSTVSRVVYALVGLAAIYVAVVSPRLGKEEQAGFCMKIARISGLFFVLGSK